MTGFVKRDHLEQTLMVKLISHLVPKITTFNILREVVPFLKSRVVTIRIKGTL